jgi:aquaporin Z
MSYSSTQKYIAEFFGTFALLFIGSGTAIFAFSLLESGLLAKIFLIGAAFGFTVMVAAYAFRDISGAHFNPAVTIATVLAGRMDRKDVVPYLVAQFLGAFVGLLTVAAIATGATQGWAAATSIDFAAQGYAGTNSPYVFAWWAAFLVEVVGTFLFVMVILRVRSTGASAANLAPVAIGFVLMILHFVAIPVDGASFNPARSLAPAVLSTIWPPTGGSWALPQYWLFLVAPIIGGILAAVFDLKMRPGKESDPPAAPSTP